MVFHQETDLMVEDSTTIIHMDSKFIKTKKFINPIHAGLFMSKIPI